MAKKEYQVRTAKVVFTLDEIVDGKLNRSQEVPLQVFEVQFDQTLQSLATALLEQANRSPESEGQGEDKKEE